jgi:class 3 adenylate cyclase
VYDSWGTTVQTAADLARRAGPDQVLVSAATRSHLPSRFMTEDYVGPGDSPGVAILSGLASEGEPVR